MKVTRSSIEQMMQEELETIQAETPRTEITRTDIRKMMEEEADHMRGGGGGLQEGLHDEGLKDGVSDYIFNELSGWHDEARAELQKHVEANGFDLTQEVLQALGAGGLTEARKRPLKRDREAFDRNQDTVSGLQKTITNYLKETGARLDTRHREIIERMSTRLMHIANSPMIKLSEGDATSRMITQLEQIGKEVKDANARSSDPDTIGRLDRIDRMITQLFDEMHNLL